MEVLASDDIVLRRATFLVGTKAVHTNFLDKNKRTSMDKSASLLCIHVQGRTGSCMLLKSEGKCVDSDLRHGCRKDFIKSHFNLKMTHATRHDE